MKTYMKVKDNPGLIRDPVSKAIISVDEQARKAYMTQRAVIDLSVNSVKKVEEEVAELKNDLAEIKALLSQVINKNS